MFQSDRKIRRTRAREKRRTSIVAIFKVRGNRNPRHLVRCFERDNVRRERQKVFYSCAKRISDVIAYFLLLSLLFCSFSCRTLGVYAKTKYQRLKSTSCRKREREREETRENIVLISIQEERESDSTSKKKNINLSNTRVVIPLQNFALSFFLV